MKIYTIGRDASSRITFTDDLISRQHAILRVHNTGKMEIIDKSANGTFINNVRIASNVPVPVKRSDIVSFARARQLDWTMVDNPFTLYRNILLGAIGVLVVVLACVLIPRACDSLSSSDDFIDEGGTELRQQPSGTSNGGGVAKSNDEKKGNDTNESVGDSAKKGKSDSWINETIKKGSCSNASKSESKDKTTNGKIKEPNVKDPKVKDPKNVNKESGNSSESSGFVM